MNTRRKKERKKKRKKERKKERKERKIFEVIMAENFSELMMDK